MASLTVPELVEGIQKSGLLEPAQFQQLTDTLQPQHADAKELARAVMNKGWLTAFQINHIVQGRGQDLTLGQYRLLERIGEGSMGQVFKARHKSMNRLVALKVIRKERLGHPDAIKRFQREIRAAATLNHPNVVMAFDADQVGDLHFFAMEFVEGINLAKLIKDAGPLPMDQVLDYTRQIALGLQHAAERGVVHRDIKPTNLLITHEASANANEKPRDIVKIFDMGLARIQRQANSQDTGSRLTQQGTMMGTPDFIAPEQATNPSTADIRADLYSLGCTIYYMATGEVPFPGGSMMEKVNKHRGEHAVPIEQLRPEIPRNLARITRKLMAKVPEERYQTPTELLQALDKSTLPDVVIEEPPISKPVPLIPSKSMPRIPPTPSRRGRRIMIAIIVILVAGLIAAVMFQQK